MNWLLQRHGANRVDHSASWTCARLLIVAALLVPLCGCTSFRGWTRPEARGKCLLNEQSQVDEVVELLNQNINRTVGWKADSIRLVYEHLPLSANLAVERGQNLRLNVNSAIGPELDLGSNNEVFWFWAKRADPHTTAYANHEDMHMVKDRLQIPFEPEWLMEVLGVTPISLAHVTLQRQQKSKTLNLVSKHRTQSGQTLEKILVVDACRGHIIEHGLYDSRGRLIARAKLRNHKVDPESGVVLARQIQIEWPEANVSMALNINQVEINPERFPESAFIMPRRPNGQLVNLAAETRIR